MAKVEVDIDLIKGQASTTIIRQAMVMKDGEWTPEEIALVGYKRLVQLKNYYSTHLPVKSQKVKIEALKAKIKELAGEDEDIDEYLARM